MGDGFLAHLCVLRIGYLGNAYCWVLYFGFKCSAGLPEFGSKMLEKARGANATGFLICLFVLMVLDYIFLECEDSFAWGSFLFV